MSLQASCVRRNSCVPPKYNAVSLTLDSQTIRQWYLKSARFMYYVTGLPLAANSRFTEYGAAPCKMATLSRWKHYANGCASVGLNGLPVTADADTTATLSAAIAAASSDTNPYVRDLMLRPSGSTATCNNVLGMVAEISGAIA